MVMHNEKPSKLALTMAIGHGELTWARSLPFDSPAWSGILPLWSFI